mmetsp:Transcript_4022/g.6805  ORF Transcript_4022/g.6805 Transcript_4022/m.6805 type:complete len:81 (-) Transcript_4022:27-269(-)
MLEKKEESNFKYLRFRLDFNMYYYMKHMQDMGGFEDDADMQGNEYGDDMDYGEQANDNMDDDDDDDGEGGIGDGADDDDV